MRYHDVELVAESELNVGTDPYLGDHLLDGNLLFPAVIGMEAMAQAAMAVTGRQEPPVVRDAEFTRPIVVPPDGSTVIRVAATVTGPGRVEVAIRSAETGFAADHFRARVEYTGGPVPDGPPDQSAASLPGVPLDPAGDLRGTSCSRAAGSGGCAATTGSRPGTSTPMSPPTPPRSGSPASCRAPCCSATPGCGTR